jgi:two-component system sensor histidine kinase DctS
MKTLPPTPTATPSPAGRRWVLWGALLALIAVAQTLLVRLTLDYESARAQEATEAVAGDSAIQLRRALLATLPDLQALALGLPERAAPPNLFQRQAALRRIEWRDGAGLVLRVEASPLGPGPFAVYERGALTTGADEACAAARRDQGAAFSRSWYAPLPGGAGQELVDLCLPVSTPSAQVPTARWLLATLALAPLLEQVAALQAAQGHELELVAADGSRLARAGARRGAGTYVGEQRVDLPGHGLVLRATSTAGRPSFVPHLNTALVLGLSLALFVVVWLLARDARRRAAAERALADALAFRQAMENSLVTGLRARDLDGRITYANAAFCRMVGWPLEVLAAVPPGAAQPYWPPELVGEYLERQRQRKQAGRVPGADGEAAELGFEGQFQRADGERFPVMIYDAPLVDGGGAQRGWMSAVLDLSAQRRAEELLRQQQERLQASARLAAVGEMASLMSHELNQPLAAIASYASGCLNMLQDDRQAVDAALLTPALGRIAEQAERAGRVIQSVHNLVARRRQGERTALGCATLLEGVLPLVRMQARKCGVRIEIELPPRELQVRVERTMLEQVLLNLSRNALQAMDDESVPAERRLLRWSVEPPADEAPNRVRWACHDGGVGLPADGVARLATPFFTTKAEGMGLGLSLCRTVLEAHGSDLVFEPGAGGVGTGVRFTLPLAVRAPTGPAAAESPAAPAATIPSP